MAITPEPAGKHDTAAPPSYAAAVAGTGPSSQRQPQQPQPTRAYPLPGDEQSHLTAAQQQRSNPSYRGSAGNAEAQWVPPANEREVRSRARKRFLVAFLWAFGIWTVLGMFIGGTVEDAREQGRHRRHSGRHNPQRPIDDAPPMDPHPHPTHTWHKITPTAAAVGGSVETDWTPRSAGAAEVVVVKHISIEELD